MREIKRNWRKSEQGRVEGRQRNKSQIVRWREQKIEIARVKREGVRERTGWLLHMPSQFNSKAIEVSQ